MAKNYCLRGALFCILTGAPLLGASFTTGYFGGYNTANGDDLVGQQGWTASNYVDDVTTATGTGSWNGHTAFRVGGLFSTPSVKTNDINHSYSDNLAGTHFSVDFAIFNSQQAEFQVGAIANVTDPANFPGRDSFGWTLRDGSNAQLFRLAFEPATLGDHMEIVWYDPSGTRNTIPPSGWDIINGNKYTVNIDFGASGGDATFNATINTLNFNGTLTGKAASQIGNFGADFDVNGTTAGDAGSNYMVFNQLTLIPEPSTSLLFAASFVGFLVRRRR